MRIQSGIPGYDNLQAQAKNAAADKKHILKKKKLPDQIAGQAEVLNNQQHKTGKVIQDSFSRSGQTQILEKAGYPGYGKAGVASGAAGKTATKLDSAAIEKLKQESEQAYSHLREMVRQLLARQGMTFKDLKRFDGDIKVDQQTRDEAAAAVADGGAMSAETVSDRIVAFARAVSGGDKGKYDALMAAIDKGFQEAERMFGDSLPDISQRTRELIDQKMNDWVNDAHV